MQHQPEQGALLRRGRNGGQGANVKIAMLDALRLAQALAAPGDWDQAVERYERDLFERSREAAGQAKQAIEAAFGDRGLEELVAVFTAIGASTGVGGGLVPGSQAPRSV